MVRRGIVRVGDLRFFNGYCTWERTQIREEIWVVLRTTRINGGLPFMVASPGYFDSRLRHWTSEFMRTQASVCLSSVEEHVNRCYVKLRRS